MSVSRKLFGTDGVRGVANAELSPSLALALGAAAAIVLREAPGETTSDVVIGCDPRISGDLLGAALIAGICSQGMNVIDIGVVPTPGVAFVTHAQKAAAGIVISASHNPVRDNGIKFFGPDGKKLPDSVEARIEAVMEDWEKRDRPTGGSVGRITRRTEPIEAYAAHLAASCEGTRLEGLRLAVDCANGSASYLAGPLFERLGATVHSLSSEPNGININEQCGSLHPEEMAAAVVRQNCNAGIAFDGDADRVILADAKGRIFDGDRILCTMGIFWKQAGQLANDVVVGTVMSNLGLENALTQHGIRLVRAPVGDRYVTEQMQATQAVLGGEKSGHILFPQLSTTGDGLLTALQVLRICRLSGRSLAEWAEVMTELPQKLVNVYVTDKKGWDTIPAIAEAMESANARLNGNGRLLVRPSGTETMIRVMAEGPNETEVDAVVEIVAKALRETIGVNRA